MFDVTPHEDEVKVKEQRHILHPSNESFTKLIILIQKFLIEGDHFFHIFY